MEYDLILRGGMVVDGTNRPPFEADVMVKGGSIVAIGSSEGVCAPVILDVRGKAVAPGFVDMHSHSDICPLVPYLPESKIYQGVTSELCGNCGKVYPMVEAVVNEGKQAAVAAMESLRGAL